MRTLVVLSLLLGAGCFEGGDSDGDGVPGDGDAGPTHDARNLNGQYTISWSCVGSECVEPFSSCVPSECAVAALSETETVVVKGPWPSTEDSMPDVAFWQGQSLVFWSFASDLIDLGAGGGPLQDRDHVIEAYLIHRTEAGFEADIVWWGILERLHVTWHVTAVRECDGSESGVPRDCP